MNPATNPHPRAPQPQPQTQPAHNPKPSPEEVEQLLLDIDPHLPRLAREVIHRRGWPLQDADIDDILQEVRIQLWTTDLGKFDANRGKLVPFVITRIYWQAASFLRDRHEGRLHYDNYVAQLEEEAPPDTPDDLVADAEQRQLLDDIVDWARQELRDPLERDAVLALVDKRTLNDVADQYWTDEWRVKQARKKGLERLRRAAPKTPEELRADENERIILAPPPDRDAANDDKEHRVRLIRLRDVMDRTGLSRATVYRLAAAGKFPASIPLTERSVGWVEAEVDGWVEAKLRHRACG